jgi:A/G-specific adenine glycosylase
VAVVSRVKNIAEQLMPWYSEHARVLPWRNPPGSPKPQDPNWPYQVWLSEIMLQQTTVRAVKSYYAKFIRNWPTLNDLARAEEVDVMTAWAGLGYYARARNLVKCARQVSERGKFPDNEEELRKLPGLGDYTSAAILAIAFDKRAVVVDTNVERIVARLFNVREALPYAKKILRLRTDEITPQKNTGDFAQAMMDLGAAICTSSNPKCTICPLKNECQGRADGNPSALPIRQKKADKKIIQGHSFWHERKGKVWLVTRPKQGILGGMRALPDDGWTSKRNGTGIPSSFVDGQNLGFVRHTFSHFSLELNVVTTSANPDGQGGWWPVKEIYGAGMPTLFLKAARLVLAHDLSETFSESRLTQGNTSLKNRQERERGIK